MRFPESALRLVRGHAALLKGIAVVGMAALGFAALHALLAEVRLGAVRAAFHALGPAQVALAVALTALSYVMLTFYDVIALRVIGRPLPWRTAALASFTSYTLSHNLGFALLTGGSARYRVYSAAGLETADIVRVIALASIAFWAGVVLLAGAALAVHPASLAIGGFAIPVAVQRFAGVAIILAIAAAMIMLHRPGRSISKRGWSLPTPTAGQMAAQVAVAALDLAAASAALYVLVPGAGLHAFPLFFLGYALAIVVALVSHVPGGIGVFEAVIMTALPGIDPPALLAGLILYRLIYYLLPLGLAAGMLAVQERRRIRRPVAAALGAAQFVLRGIAPTVLAALVFVGGIVLLVSGSLPAIPARLHALHDIVPLPFVEASHIAASLAGTGLLLIAPGLYRRLDAAFLLCRALLIAGAAFSIAKGVDYEEAALLAGIAGLLQLSRPAFYRRTAMTVDLLTPRSIVAIVVALLLSTWIGFFAFKHVAYRSDLWWQFAWNGDASRFLRASFAIAVLLVGVVIVRLLGHARPALAPARPDREDVGAALGHSRRTDAMLALTGDKRFLRSASGDALLMYQVQGQSWIVMGDPIGPREEWAELLWALREQADAAQGRLLLYQISMDAVPIAIDLGLQLVKYGEEARVALDRFTLDGSDMRALRHAERRAIREEAAFEIVPAARVPEIMAALRAVSDEWLHAKGHGEKAFSIGRFDPAYLERFDIAVIRRQGRIVAFANIWATPNREELSVDLMRHARDAPYGAMDYLFVQLMKWGKAQGFRWFTLGLAPLAGLEARRLAPVWARAGALLYRHGDAFYGFEGLRAYKDKFAPVWEPRYIAGPHGVGLARGLIDLQTLVGGGTNSAARRTKLALAA